MVASHQLCRLLSKFSGVLLQCCQAGWEDPLPGPPQAPKRVHEGIEPIAHPQKAFGCTYTLDSFSEWV